MSIPAQCLRGVGLCTIPKQDNDYRPLALRHNTLAFVSSLLISIKILTVLVIALTPTPAKLSTITSSRIVQLTNVERTKAGLNNLSISPKLTAAAQQKGEDMLKNDYFAHISPSGVTPWFWMYKVGYSYQVAGENLAIDFVEAEDVVAAWMASPGHKENLMHSDYVETGVAVVTGEFQGSTSTIVVHMFGKPTNTSTADAEVPPTPKVKAKTAHTPTPTPTPAITPTPSVKPSPTPTPDIKAPVIPIVSASNNVTSIQDQVLLEITGEALTTVVLSVNNQERGDIILDNNGQAKFNLDITDLPDGQIVIRASSIDKTRNTSDQSKPLILTKSTYQQEKPTRNIFSFIISPNISSSEALILTNDNSAQLLQNDNHTPANQQLVSLLQPTINFSLQDSFGNLTEPISITLKPHFFAEQRQEYSEPSESLTQSTRLLTVLVIIVVLILLSMTILIQIRIQRPAILTHAFLVLILGTMFLLI